MISQTYSKSYEDKFIKFYSRFYKIYSDSYLSFYYSLKIYININKYMHILIIFYPNIFFLPTAKLLRVPL